MSDVSKNTVVTLTGTNHYLLSRKLREVKDEFIAEYSDFGVEAIDGEEASLEQVQGALDSMPFLSSKKLLILKNLSANKQAVEKIDELLSAVGSATDVIIVEPKPDKRGSYYKTLQKKTNLQQYNELDENTLVNWLVQEAKARKGQLSVSDARYLVDRIGINQQLLEREITKLLDYDTRITRDSIDDLTDASPQGTVFNLLDSAFSGNQKRTLEMYESQRAQKVEPQAILAMIVWQLHAVALVSASKKSIEEIAKDTKQNPFVLRKAKAISDRLSRTELKELLHNLCILDKRLKSEAIDADEAIINLLMTLSRV